MQKIETIDCQDLSFSAALSKNRIDRAVGALGVGVIRRLLCFALYLLGLNRMDIGRSLGLPAETVKSVIKTLLRDGLSALHDRRRQSPTLTPPPCPQLPPVVLTQEQDVVVLDLGGQDRLLKLDQNDPLQLRIVLLSLLNSGLLTAQQVAEAIGLSGARTKSLAQQLLDDGALSLIDRRQGQKQDYRVTAEIKAEIIQQFTVDIITAGQTSGTKISEELNQRCRITLPARTVRHHLGKLGLPKIKHSLPELVSALKKNSNDGA